MGFNSGFKGLNKMYNGKVPILCLKLLYVERFAQLLSVVVKIEH